MSTIIEQGECLQDEQTSGNGQAIHYTLTDDGTLTISGQGTIAAGEWTAEEISDDLDRAAGGWSDRFSRPSQFRHLNAQIKRVVIEEGITGLADESFCLMAMEELVLPETLIYAGVDSFAECSRLERVVLPSSLKCISRSMFNNCESLRQIVIPEGIETIEDQAFFYCENLETVYLPDSLKRVESLAFAGCPCEEVIMAQYPVEVLPSTETKAEDDEDLLF